jgi:2-oxoisovalerate dehydrogenase E2 component (dihydrolipoyl transacylase)
VRRLARELGVDLAALSGSGPGGSLTADDVHGAAKLSPQAPGEPLRGPRRAMAQTMARAGAEVVAATVTDAANIAAWSGASDPLLRLIAAVVEAAGTEPALNAWYDGASMRRQMQPHVDLGIAMDTPDGLFVPVLKGADGMGDADRHARLKVLKEAVHARSIAPQDLSGATITLSNFGTIAGRHGVLVVVPPQVAILGAGRIAPSVVAIDGQPRVCPTLPLSLTFDHRAVTGGEAARFLAAVIAALEQPA